MVENLVSSYKCPFCGSTSIWEQNIDIVGAAGNTVNIDMHCPSCKKHFMAKTEVMQVELGSLSADKLEQIQSSLSALKWKLGGNISVESKLEAPKENSIKEENILGLRDAMKKTDFSLDDLFSEGSDNV